MAKSLEMTFVTNTGKLSRLTIDNPKEPIDTVVVKQAMEQIIAADVFEGSNGTFAVVEGVRVIDRNVTEYELV